jgi:hypothetical protein
MTASAAELRGGYDIARRDLPWRNPVSEPVRRPAWMAIRGGLVRGLEEPCQMDANARRRPPPEVGLKIITGNVRLDPSRLRRLPFRPWAGNPDDGIYLLIICKDLDHAGAYRCP